MLGPRRGDLLETKIQRDLAKGRGQEHGVLQQDDECPQEKKLC